MSLDETLRKRVPQRFIIILGHRPEPEDTVLSFQTYVRDGQAFVPIFDSVDALRSAGGADGKPVFEMDRAVFISALNGTEPLVLNPSLLSELSFRGSDLLRVFSNTSQAP